MKNTIIVSICFLSLCYSISANGQVKTREIVKTPEDQSVIPSAQKPKLIETETLVPEGVKNEQVLVFLYEKQPLIEFNKADFKGEKFFRIREEKFAVKVANRPKKKVNNHLKKHNRLLKKYVQKLDLNATYVQKSTFNPEDYPVDQYPYAFGSGASIFVNTVRSYYNVNTGQSTNSGVYGYLNSLEFVDRKGKFDFKNQIMFGMRVKRGFKYAYKRFRKELKAQK